MKKCSRWLVVLFVTATFLFAGMSDVFARRSGGSFRSAPRRSAPRKTAPRKTASRKTKPKSSGRTRSAPKKNAVSRQSYQKAKQNGTAFKSKAEATKAFKTKNASKYTSTYKSKPATRPSHIPQTTNVGGTNVNISYNSGYGGYGYMNTLGVWMMYDAMADAAMTNRLMAQNHYVYGRPPANVGGILLWTLGIIVVGAVVIACFANRNKQST